MIRLMMAVVTGGSGMIFFSFLFSFSFLWDLMCFLFLSFLAMCGGMTVFCIF